VEAATAPVKFSTHVDSHIIMQFWVERNFGFHPLLMLHTAWILGFLTCTPAVLLVLPLISWQGW
jgi:hypothetical protein